MDDAKKYLTIGEAAERLGVHKDTIRNKIKNKDLRAEKVMGPYGPQWYIPESEINIALEVKDVVPVKRELTLDQLNSILEQAIEDRMQGMITLMNDHMSTLMKQNESLQKQVESLCSQLKSYEDKESERTERLLSKIDEKIEQRDSAILSAIREKQEAAAEEKKKGFWARLFG